MKRLLFSIIILFTFQSTYCQLKTSTNDNVTQDSYDFYMSKYKKNKKTAKTLTWVGGIATTAGLVIIISEIPGAIVDAAFDENGESSTSFVGPMLLITGATSLISSLVINSKANSYKEKARLSLLTINYKTNDMSFKKLPALTISLTIPLN